MPKLPDIEDFINYNKNVGPLQLISIGYPGTGKSSHATNILIKCFARKKETAIMHGDLTCEWRHFLRYSKYVKKIKVIFPKEADIFKINIDKLFDDKYKVELLFIEDVDFNTLNVMDYLEDKCLVVVYDDCFYPTSKTILWRNIAHQLISRDKMLDYTITYLCHEAGNYYPQTANKEQWKAVDDFVSYFVYFRKMGIRAILLTQLESEVSDRLRKKCIWKVYRICYPRDRGHARLIKKYIKKMSISNYNLFYGDLYSPLNINKTTKKIKIKTMIVPRILINLKGGADRASEQAKKVNPKKEIAVRMRESGESERVIAFYLEIAPSTSHEWTKHVGKGVKPKEKALDTEITA